MNNLTKAFSAGLLAIATTGAFALPTGGGSVAFSSVDGVDFTWDNDNDSFDFDTTQANGVVDATSGTFVAEFVIGSDATFYDFDYDVDFVAGTIWESNGITFDLTSILGVSELSSSVIIEGTGSMTDGVESITTGILLTFGASGSGSFSWNSTTSVPEPAPLALLGVGLVGIALARRKQQA